MPFTLALGQPALSRLLDPALNYRAYCDVVVVNANANGVARKSPVYQCLVDTGSDYTILPWVAATAIGLTPSGPVVTIRSVGGRVYRLMSDEVAIEIEGKLVRVPVAFSAAGGFSPILGRSQLLAAYDFGFDTSHWHWG
ncbi:MAG: retropepsin-like domain-containing protein [Gemmataceae bacterium]|nr:retropepsin-like domain-containing protein [Gemmataceae bacterium]